MLGTEIIDDGFYMKQLRIKTLIETAIVPSVITLKCFAGETVALLRLVARKVIAIIETF